MLSIIHRIRRARFRPLIDVILSYIAFGFKKKKNQTVFVSKVYQSFNMFSFYTHDLMLLFLYIVLGKPTAQINYIGKNCDRDNIMYLFLRSESD